MSPRPEPGRKGPVSLAVENAIATITLGSPETGNSVDAAMARSFWEACGAVAADDSVRVVLVSARGADFCTGGVSAAAAAPVFDEYRVAATLAEVEQPVVVALRGRVTDQGLELALAADIRIAAADTRMAMCQVVDGGFPFDGGTQRLPRIAGQATAAEMLLTGRALDAQDALAAGLVSEVVPVADVDERARAIALEIARGGAVATRYAKEAVSASADLTLQEGLRLESDLSILLHGTPERTEGLEAFRARRKPRMPGAPEREGGR